MRFIRLALGIAILAQGIIARDTVTILLGLAFTGMAFANIGCCGSNGCAVNTRPINKNTLPNEEQDSPK